MQTTPTEITLENVEVVLEHYAQLNKLKKSLESQTYTNFNPLLRKSITASVENLSPYVEHEHQQVSYALESADHDIISYSTVTSLEGFLGAVWDKIKGFFSGIAAGARAFKDSIGKWFRRLVAGPDYKYLMKNEKAVVSAKPFQHLANISSGTLIKKIGKEYYQYFSNLASAGAEFDKFYRDKLMPHMQDPQLIILGQLRKPEDEGKFRDKLMDSLLETNKLIESTKADSPETNPFGLAICFKKVAKPEVHYEIDTNAKSKLAANAIDANDTVRIGEFIYDMHKYAEDFVYSFVFAYIKWAEDGDQIWGKIEEFMDKDDENSNSILAVMNAWVWMYRGYDVKESAIRAIQSYENMVVELADLVKKGKRP